MAMGELNENYYRLSEYEQAAVMRRATLDHAAFMRGDLSSGGDVANAALNVSRSVNDIRTDYAARDKKGWINNRANRIAGNSTEVATAVTEYKTMEEDLIIAHGKAEFKGLLQIESEIKDMLIVDDEDTVTNKANDKIIKAAIAVLKTNQATNGKWVIKQQALFDIVDAMQGATSNKQAMEILLNGLLRDAKNEGFNKHPLKKKAADFIKGISEEPRYIFLAPTPVVSNATAEQILPCKGQAVRA